MLGEVSSGGPSPLPGRARPLGTAGAIRFAAELGDGSRERFLALNGDSLTDLDLGALVELHGERAPGDPRALSG